MTSPTYSKHELFLHIHLFENEFPFCSFILAGSLATCKIPIWVDFAHERKSVCRWLYISQILPWRSCLPGLLEERLYGCLAYLVFFWLWLGSYLSRNRLFCWEVSSGQQDTSPVSIYSQQWPLCRQEFNHRVEEHPSPLASYWKDWDLIKWDFLSDT